MGVMGNDDQSWFAGQLDYMRGIHPYLGAGDARIGNDALES